MPLEIHDMPQIPRNSSGFHPSLPEGIPPLNALYLYISGSCNLACHHCWVSPAYHPGGAGGSYIAFAHVQQAVRKAIPLGLRSVKLTGGEPLLHPDFRRIVRFIIEQGLNLLIETNGTLLTRDLARLMKQGSASAFVSVSLDGADAETHEGLRGVEGSYDSALDGIRVLVEEGFRPQVICTLHRGNAHQMGAMVGLAERLGCGSVKFNHVQRVGRGEKFAEMEGLKFSEVIDLYRRAEREFLPRSKMGIHFDMPFAFQSIRGMLYGHLNRCRIRNILGVLAGGELALCGIGTTVPELIYGSLDEDDLVDVWCRNPDLSRLREEIPSQLEGICARCLHNAMCMGHCVADNFKRTGRLNAPHQFCDSAHALGRFPQSRMRPSISNREYRMSCVRN